jgi:RNA polymerase sigma factor (sigma-70 family)
MDDTRSVGTEALVEAILERWRADPRRGVSAIYRCYAPRLLDLVTARLRGVVRRNVDPGDVLHAVFERLLVTAPPAAIGNEAQLLAYLATAIENELRSQHRRHTRQCRDHEREERDAPRLDRLRGPRGASPTPSEVAVGRETHDRFLAALARLPTAQRNAWLEATLRDCTSAEGATRLGMPSAAAFRQNLARAVARLTLAVEGDPAPRR